MLHNVAILLVLWCFYHRYQGGLHGWKVYNLFLLRIFNFDFRKTLH